MNKKIKKIALIMIGSLVAILITVVLSINVIAKAGIEKGAAYALGVNTKAEGIRVGLLTGKFRLSSLIIDNPDGFTDPHIMKFGKFSISVKPMSLLSKNVHLEKFEIDGLELIIEQQIKRNNVSVILKHLEQLSGEGEKEETDGKKIIIDEVVIKNIVASVRLPSLAGKLGRAKIKIKEIRITDFGTEKEQRPGVFQVTRRIFSEVIVAVIQKSGGLLPDDLISSIGDGISTLSSAVYKGGKAVVKGSADGMKAVGRGTIKGVKTVTDKIPLIGKGKK